MAKYRASQSFGSHASHGQRMGAGPVAGTKQVEAGGPGGGRTGIGSNFGRVNPEIGVEKAASGKTPKGTQVYKQGS